MHLTLEGPLQEPDLIYADAFYPLRLAVGDVLHVPSGQHKSAEPTTPQYLATPIEFSLRVCKELKPYLLDSAGLCSLAAPPARALAGLQCRRAHVHGTSLFSISLAQPTPFMFCPERLSMQTMVHVHVGSANRCGAVPDASRQDWGNIFYIDCPGRRPGAPAPKRARGVLGRQAVCLPSQRRDL